MNIKDLGAVGDGSTDDTAAFEAAAGNSQYAAIKIPAGSYIVKKKIAFNRPVSLIGEGAGVTTITWAEDSTSSGITIEV